MGHVSSHTSIFDDEIADTHACRTLWSDVWMDEYAAQKVTLASFWPGWDELASSSDMKHMSPFLFVRLYLYESGISGIFLLRNAWKKMKEPEWKKCLLLRGPAKLVIQHCPEGKNERPRTNLCSRNARDISPRIHFYHSRFWRGTDWYVTSQFPLKNSAEIRTQSWCCSSKSSSGSPHFLWARENKC